MPLRQTWKFRARASAARVLLGLTAAATACANERYEGRAFAADSNLLEYIETDWLFDEADGARMRLVLYRCANGVPFARKLVRAMTSDTTPDFEFVDARDGYAEGVRSERAQRSVFVRPRAGEPLQQKTIDLAPDAVIDAGFDALIRAHWDRLAHDGSMSGSFLIPGRLEFLPIKITRQPGGESDGLVRMRLVLDRWYGFALPKMQVTYRETDHRLEQFEGIGNVRDASLRRASLRIEFPESARSSVSRAEIDAALHAPLSPTCG